ncbi:MAG TPA: hypothetical protein VKD08_15075 [Ignavibacteriaceae bacterium]|jgi:hypothetical protein|nr:hypothetical protein [Ignavibacteriaceae bacterium]
MRPVYLRKEANNIVRKVMMDMAYLASHHKIRLTKRLYEDGLYFYFKNKDGIDKYYLSRDRIKKEDEFHYFFDFPFKEEQVEGVITED